MNFPSRQRLPLLLLFAFSASAAAAGSETVLPTVVVAGEAAAPDQVSLEQAQRNISFDMKDLFRGVPEVSIGGGARNAQRIYLNGVEGTNLNITIDGARQGRTLFQHRGGMTGIDPDLLKRVTVDSGGGGAGALGGSIRLQTVDAQDLLADGRRVGVRLKTGYASVDQTRRGGLSAYGLLADKLGLLVHLSAANYDDYRIGGGKRVTFSAGRERDYLLALSLLDVDGHSLRLRGARNQSSGLYARGSHGSDFGYYIPPKGKPRGPMVPYYQRLERDSWTAEYRYAPQDAALVWQANAYRNENTLSYPESKINDIFTEETGLGASASWHYKNGGLHNKLTFGADYFTEKSHSTQLRVPRAGLHGKRFTNTSKNLGLFVQNRLRWQAWQLALGARFDDYSAEYGARTLSGNRISPNARLQFAVSDALALHVGYSEAVRASGIVPVGFLGRLYEGTKIPGGKLKPESSQRKEIGLAFHHNGLFAKRDRFDASFKYFDTRIKNMIAVPGRGSIPAARLFNSAPVDIDGWSLALGWRLQGYASTLSLNRAKARRNDQPLGAVRRTAASQGDRLVWDHRWQASEAIMLGYTLEAVARLKDVPAKQPQRPGYVLHSLQAQWQPGAVKGLTLKLAAHNLFDKRYARHTTLYSSRTGIVEEPGRDIRLALEYQF